MTPSCSGSPKSSVHCTICAPLCGVNEGQKWRNEMQALVDAEAPGAASGGTA